MRMKLLWWKQFHDKEVTFFLPRLDAINKCIRSARIKNLQQRVLLGTGRVSAIEKTGTLGWCRCTKVSFRLKCLLLPQHLMSNLFALMCAGKEQNPFLGRFPAFHHGNMHKRIQPALCPQDFFKIMQFSAILREKPLFWANFGLSSPGVKTPLPPDLDPGSAPDYELGGVACMMPWEQCRLRGTRTCTGIASLDELMVQQDKLKAEVQTIRAQSWAQQITTGLNFEDMSCLYLVSVVSFVVHSADRCHWTLPHPGNFLHWSWSHKLNPMSRQNLAQWRFHYVLPQS